MTNLELYRIFYIVSQTRNITKASEILHISQPAITKHIKNLENDLNTILFTRTRKGVVLTNDGQKLFNEVKKALTIIDNAEKDINNNLNNNCGSIKIGINTSLAKLYLMKYIESFNKLYPNIQFELNNDTTKNNLKLLQNGLIDIVIAKKNNNLDNDLSFIKLGVTSYEFISNKPITKTLTLEQLNNYPILFPKEPSSTYNSINNLFKNKQIKPNTKMTIGGSSLIHDFVKIDYGIGYTTKLYIEKELKNKELFIINTTIPKDTIEYGIITLNNNILPNSCQKFIEYIKNKV